MSSSDNYRICTFCGCQRSIMGDCAECYRVREFTNAIKNQSKTPAEIKADNSGAAILGGLCILAFFLFGKSADETSVVSGPNSSYYVATGGTVKRSLTPGIQYEHYGDGSCTKKDGAVCLSHAQAKQFCEEFDGVNTVDTRFHDFTSQTADGKGSSGIKVSISTRQGYSIDQTYTITGLSRGFSDACYLKVSVSGEYSGRTTTYVSVASWKVNSEGKLVATSTMVAPENRAKNAIGGI